MSIYYPEGSSRDRARLYKVESLCEPNLYKITNQETGMCLVANPGFVLYFIFFAQLSYFKCKLKDYQFMNNKHHKDLFIFNHEKQIKSDYSSLPHMPMRHTNCFLNHRQTTTNQAQIGKWRNIENCQFYIVCSLVQNKHEKIGIKRVSFPVYKRDTDIYLNSRKT